MLKQGWKTSYVMLFSSPFKVTLISLQSWKQGAENLKYDFYHFLS